SAASGGYSEPEQGQRSQSARGFCSRSTMRVPQPDIIEHFGNADAVPQPPERCLSRQTGIVRCCHYFYFRIFGGKNQCLPVYSGIKKNGVFHRCEIKADPQVTLLRRFWRAPYGSAGTGLAGRGLGRIAILGKACYSDFM
ncbi:MAG: hypothetical protein PUH36_04430, partial [Subdoligranulum sp.]|nr:hypothetical protein [Subdoligranulum sp.]